MYGASTIFTFLRSRDGQLLTEALLLGSISTQPNMFSGEIIQASPLLIDVVHQLEPSDIVPTKRKQELQAKEVVTSEGFILGKV